MEDKIYAHNSRVIEERWPDIWPHLAEQDIDNIPVSLTEGLCNTISIGDIQLSSRHDRKAESQTQASTIPEKGTVYVYGPGLGDLPVELLKRDSLERLEIKIMNPAVFSLLLYLQDQGRWLSDPRVNLSFAANDPEIGVPFFANPAELLLSEDKAGGIMQRLEAEIAHDYNAKQFQPDDQDIRRRIEANRVELENDSDVSELFNTLVDTRAYIIGAGPTLAENIEKLKALRNSDEQSVVIAVDTAMPFLVENNVVPDIVVTMDRVIDSHHFGDNQPDSIKLVYFPLISNDVIKAWPGPRFSACSIAPMYDNIRKEFSKGTLFSGGSVIHPAIDLGVKMGCSEVVLLGCDFAYPLGRTHAGWQDGDLGVSIYAANSWAINGNNVRIKSDPSFNTYRCEVERYVAKHRDTRFYNSSREGAKIVGLEFHKEFCE